MRVQEPVPRFFVSHTYKLYSYKRGTGFKAINCSLRVKLPTNLYLKFDLIAILCSNGRVSLIQLALNGNLRGVINL